MNQSVLYPKNTDELITNILLLMDGEENFGFVDSISSWLKLFRSLNYKFEDKLKDNEYLRVYYNDSILALQIWKHSDLVDSCLRTLITNKFIVYCDDKTIVTE